jgi:putative ABC transport system permease protein
MGVIQCFFLALKSLSTSKMRAFLTMLGIIIGVAAVIVIMSLGNGLTVYVNDVFSELGTTTVNVIITGRG